MSCGNWGSNSSAACGFRTSPATHGCSRRRYEACSFPGETPTWSYPMKKEKQSDPQMQKLADLINEASIAMLTTEESDGALRSRPLATLQMDSEGKLWFFTALSSGKVSEIDQHRKVNLSYAHVDKQDFVSISGHA